MSTTTPAATSTTSAGGLDWREGSHWSNTLLPCVHCRVETNLRDAAGCPSHKVCAEDRGAGAAGAGGGAGNVAREPAATSGVAA